MSLVPPPLLEPDEVPEAAGGSASSQMAECSDDTPADELALPGVMLQQQREARGLTLDDIARTTKIGKHTLRTIEDSDVLHLPAAIYTRGFVKVYAREIGLNADQTAEEYLRRIERLKNQHLVVADGQMPPLAEQARPVDANGDARDLLAANQVRRFGRLTLAAAAVGLLVYVTSFGRREDAPLTMPTQVSNSDALPADGGAADRIGDAARASLTNAPLRVEFVPQAPCWVSIRVGGETVLAKLLQPGDREAIDVVDEAIVRVGEPGALSYSINGQSGRTLGPAGQPVTVRISKDNFREFLSS